MVKCVCVGGGCSLGGSRKGKVSTFKGHSFLPVAVLDLGVLVNVWMQRSSTHTVFLNSSVNLIPHPNHVSDWVEGSDILKSHRTFIMPGTHRLCKSGNVWQFLRQGVTQPGLTSNWLYDWGWHGLLIPLPSPASAPLPQWHLLVNSMHRSWDYSHAPRLVSHGFLERISLVMSSLPLLTDSTVQFL